jgi:hypothetical protein
MLKIEPNNFTLGPKLKDPRMTQTLSRQHVGTKYAKKKKKKNYLFVFWPKEVMPSIYSWPLIAYHHFKHGRNVKEEESTQGRQCTYPFFGPTKCI